MMTTLPILLMTLLALSLLPSRAASLWNDNARSRIADTRARAVGDLLTVIVEQSSVSATTAKHSTDKGINVNGGAGSGWLKGFTGLGVKTDRTTSGTGTAAASTSFIDRITVRVVEVMPNGCLRVEGTRAIRLERDEMTLIFRGIVRQEDITPDNTVSSIVVADQRLESKGNGPIAEKQRPGLISKLLSLLW